ncbi:MAG: Nif3-like dinuclear metal center hexameric protein [Pirellulaceae bacterium]|nr:Nif3-like dinuclear metal center hexameric protein [Pirellulaceae bacterium]
MTDSLSLLPAVTVRDLVQIMEQIAPLALSESWDNTGLLLGSMNAAVERVMTCLTLTPESVQEAIQQRASLVISHHPLPFKPLAKITSESYTGHLIWQLASHRIGIYSPHTAWDSAPDGINAQLARKLSLIDIEPLIPNAAQPQLGAGRFGRLTRASDIPTLARKLSSTVPHCRPRAVMTDRPIGRVALGCGSGGTFVSVAAQQGCDLLVTGEATFHTCLEAQSLGMGLLLIGHFASEKFAMDQMATRLANAFPQLTVWGSLTESDPVCSLMNETKSIP